jgi:NADH:ubiquinone oxidoreductase subunit 4 (subunit M)
MDAMKLKITLADGWQQLHKRGTVILSGTLAAISAFGPVIREAWHTVPDDLKSIIPAHTQQAIAYAILFASIIAVRYTSVKRVPKEGDDGADHA